MGLIEYDRRKKLGWRWQALDGALTKAPLGGEKSGPNPTDRAKRGVKRSVLTEAHGVPIGLAIAGANRHDSQLVRPTLASVPIRRPQPTRQKPQHLDLDKAYFGDPVQEVVQEFGYTAHVPPRGAQGQEIKHQTRHKVRRWVVERTHSWMNRFRRIIIRWEKKPENYFALLHLVCALITYRAAGLLG
jgi:transposase